MQRISPVVKNLIIINVLMMVATYIYGNYVGVRNPLGLENPMIRYLALFYPKSEYFEPYQFVTHMFMHGGLTHIFFNMYALWMFGTPLENNWGGKKFLFFYLFTGLGAAALHTLVNHIVYSGIAADITAFTNAPSPELFAHFVQEHKDVFNQRVYDFINTWKLSPSNQQYISTALAEMQQVYTQSINIPTVGASGAIFGVLLAFGMMWPNAQLMLIFPPIPLKAKWLVLGYGALELVLGVSQPGSGIAHFAHIGGMLFGYILIKYWQRKSRSYFS